MTALQAQAGADAPGETPAQRKFKRLQRQLEQLRADIQAWDEALPLFMDSYRQRVEPLQAPIDKLQEDYAQALADCLAQTGWRKPERELLVDLLTAELQDILSDPSLSEVDRARWTALHDHHAEFSIEEASKADLESLIHIVRAQTNLDLGDEPVTDFDDLAARMAQSMAQRQAAQEGQHSEADPAAEHFAGPHGPGPSTAKRPTAAQKRRAAEQQAAQTQLTQSRREAFRKLASALHPDRAQDDDDRQRRTALMQRVNQAYAANDLLALLTLQLETEQIDAEHIARASTTQLKHFNEVLQQQLDELRGAMLMREESFCHQFDYEPRSRLKASQLGKVLQELVVEQTRRTHLLQQDIRHLSTRNSAKRWLKAVRAEQQFDPFSFFF